MSEANELTNKIIAHVYASGGYAWRASSVGIYDEKRRAYRTASKKGVSDVLACYRGILIAIEVKIGRDRLRPEQEGFLANVRHVGGRAFVAKEFEAFKAEFAAQTAGILPAPPFIP